jgi:Collagenase NC10 and Endostatin
MLRIVAVALAAVCLAACTKNSTAPSERGTGTTFFVTSSTSVTGNLGGLRGADAICQNLASAVGAGNKTWRAYLSAERDPSSGSRVDARSRIGAGPWFNAKGELLANSLTELHARKGDSTVFVNERGEPINGQWVGSPAPVQHDIMTGSNADGTLMTGFTCGDWTSDSTTTVAQVGHSDGFGTNRDTSGSNSSWNSAHANQNCSNTAPRGGAGRIYCFATN